MTILMLAVLAGAGILHATTTFQVAPFLMKPPENPVRHITIIRMIIVGVVVVEWAMLLVAAWVTTIQLQQGG